MFLGARKVKQRRATPFLSSAAGRASVDRPEHGDYQAIDLSQWLASNPAYLLADHFGTPQAVFEKFPKGRAFISPPDQRGQRAIK